MHRSTLSLLFCGFIEWYDFALYGHLSYLFSKIFFPSSSMYTSILLALGTFAVGFVARPIGAIVFGYIGDKKGRKISFLSSLITMLVANAAFTIVPTFEVLGIVSPIILVLIRITQGLSLGGESGGVVLMAENVSKRYRVFVCGMKPVSSICGVIAGYFAVEISSNLFSEMQFQAWAWRLPVILGFIMTCCILYLRIETEDNPLPDSFSTFNPLLDVFLHNKRKLLISSGIFSLSASSFYIFTILLNLMLQTSYQSKGLGIIIYGLLMLTAVFSCVASSLICSIFSPRRVAMIVASLFIISSYAVFYFIELKFMSAYFILAILSGFYISSVVFIPISIFPQSIRQTGVSLAYNIGGAIFGGTAPAICVWLIRVVNNNIAPSFYLIFCSILALISLYFSKDEIIYD